MATDNFFEESLEQSRIKARIVTKYFFVWAKIILNSSRNDIAYVDLFAGKGRYSDGTKSTPLQVLQAATNDSEIAARLKTLFNDGDSDNAASLQSAIEADIDLSKLTYKPLVMNIQVGAELVDELKNITKIPSLFFIDPWGYKGLSLELIRTAIKDWGCDCIFFFNYNRINMGLNNPKVKEHMDDLFGVAQAEILREKVSKIENVSQRELTIVEALTQALHNKGGKYVLPFRFKKEDGSRTSHHLIFVSKHFRGFEVMKDVMHSMSSEVNDTVGSFEYNRASREQPMLYGFSPRPLEDLKEEIFAYFQGREITTQALYEEHSSRTRFLKRHYKESLKQLEKEGRIKVISTTGKRPSGTFADHLIITFPNI